MTKIVQCPSCNTKFALNESQIAGIDDPKFQCSRCQTIFNLNEENPPEEEPTEVTKPEYIPISEEDNHTPDSPLHAEWNLGKENSVISNEDEKQLEDFSIDISKFSLGTNLQAPKTAETPPIAQQLDFSFNQPIISHPESKNDYTLTSDPEPTLKDSPTQRISRINPELLDTLVYGESGSDDSKINLSWDDNEKPAPDKTSEPDDLLGIFRSGSRRSSSGTYDRQTIISETDMTSPIGDSTPSWSQLKEKMEKQDDEENNHPAIKHLASSTSESKFSDLASIDLMNSPFKDFNDPAKTKNRSMKHTTVMKRDELEVEGFMRPTDQEEETFYGGAIAGTARKEKIKWNAQSPLNFIKRIPALIKFLDLRRLELAPFTKSLIFAWSLPGVFLILLFFWGQSLNNKNNLNQAENIFTNAVALFTPPELLIPPVNLVLNTLSAELRPDKSGDPMIVISGFIFNAGFQTVLNPTIEARTFDNGNTLVKSIKAPIPNELSRFASSLNLVEIEKEEILKLQNQRSWDGIAPSKSIPFKIVVTDIGPGYKFFSAKIYSVTEII